MVEDPGRLASRRIAGPVHRILPSRFPPVTIFELARSAEELEMLAELEGLTNERLRDATGALQRVPPEDRVFGPGTTPIMAAFCHPAPSRFTDGSFGIYYAGLAEETAILETVYHRERFLRDAQMPAEVLEMRRYVSELRQPMHLLPLQGRAALLHPDDYGPAQRFGRALRDRRSWGLHYPSVRHRGGHCVAVLRPPALTPVSQAAHYRYCWNGQAIERVERVEAYTVQRSRAP